MVRRLVWAATIILAITTTPMISTAAAELVELCHHSADHPEHHVMIAVAAAAVPAHLAHGDHLHDDCPGHDH